MPYETKTPGIPGVFACGAGIANIRKAVIFPGRDIPEGLHTSRKLVRTIRF